jgi:low affinity Fe/Cu permease
MKSESGQIQIVYSLIFTIYLIQNMKNKYIFKIYYIINYIILVLKYFK